MSHWELKTPRERAEKEQTVREQVASWIQVVNRTGLLQGGARLLCKGQSQRAPPFLVPRIGQKGLVVVHLASG